MIVQSIQHKNLHLIKQRTTVITLTVDAINLMDMRGESDIAKQRSPCKNTSYAPGLETTVQIVARIRREVVKQRYT